MGDKLMGAEESVDDFKPKLVPCKKWVLFSRKDGDIYCIGNEETGDFVKVPSDQLSVIESVIKYFDGEHPIRWIHEHIAKTMDLDVPVDEIFTVFRDANLIENWPKENPDEFQMTSMTLASKNLGWLFESRPKLSQKVFYPIFFSSALLVIIGTSIFIIMFAHLLFSQDVFMIEESTAVGIMFSFVIIYVSSFVHEIGHIIVAWYFGVPPKQLRILLYLGVFPMLFVNIPNIYTASRRQRILIAVAGIYTNLVIASIASLLLLIFDPSTIFYRFLKQIATLNFITPFFILNPFLPGDGYFLAVNLFKTPNIRKDAFGKLRKMRSVKWTKRDLVLLAYGVLSIALSAYFFYWFLEWFTLALVETIYTIPSLYTVSDYVLVIIKLAFFVLMLYSSLKTIHLMVRRIKRKTS